MSLSLTRSLLVVCVCNMNLLPPTTANEFSAACDEPNPPPAGSELGAPLVEFCEMAGDAAGQGS